MSGLWVLAGALVGVLNGLSRWWTVARLRAGMAGSPLKPTLGAMVARLALVAGLLIAALRNGILPGLLAFAGLWLTRSAAAIWLHKSSWARSNLDIEAE
ncbi:MAG: ATP synthase subunit I [Anaerolineae bacterium]|nr:ATP synthase subunit I [Anaerolineae bacterium]